MLDVAATVRRWPTLPAGTSAIVPSLLAADPLHLGDALSAIAGADACHIDVMDGHFVPNLAFTPAQVRAIAQSSSLPLDVHLMMKEPLAWAERFADAGAFGITVHAEAVEDIVGTLKALSRLGVAPGLSVRPDTNVAAVLARLQDAAPWLSMLLVMSVPPGFGGQAFDPRALEHLARASAFKRDVAPQCRIEVDGGIEPATARRACEAGAEALVIGTSLFSTGDVPRALRTMRAALDRSARG